MARWSFAVPVLPGKEAEPGKFTEEVVHDHWDAYVASRARAGITVERVFQMTTPMGDFITVYGEGHTVGSTMETYRSSNDPFDAWFMQRTGEMHGIDLSLSFPEPEEFLYYADANAAIARKPAIGFCAPIPPGNTDAVRAFGKEVSGPRLAEMTESRRAKHVTREQAYITQTAMGDILCVYIEGDDPTLANKSFAESDSAFDVWFKDRAGGLLRIDFGKPLPPIRVIQDYVAH